MVRTVRVAIYVLAAISSFLCVLNAMPIVWPVDRVLAAVIAVWGSGYTAHFGLQALRAFERHH